MNAGTQVNILMFDLAQDFLARDHPIGDMLGEEWVNNIPALCSFLGCQEWARAIQPSRERLHSPREL